MCNILNKQNPSRLLIACFPCDTLFLQMDVIHIMREIIFPICLVWFFLF